MLSDWLLSLLHGRSSPRARSHAHGHLPLRAGLHLLLIGIAALAALLTARLVTDTEAVQVSSIPSAPLSGVRAIAPTGESFLRPGVSHTTIASPLRAALATPQVPLRPTDPVAEGETISDGVGRATAAGQDAGYDIRALTDQIDPEEPYVIYEVRGGDTLGEIAETYDTTVDNILLNNAEVWASDDIQPGQKILVPQGSVHGILYLVGHGETLSGIIDEHLDVTIQDVLDHRPNNLLSSDDIKPGSYILLPNASRKPPPEFSPDGWIITPPPPVSPGRFGLPLASWDFISDYFGTDRGGGRIHTGIDLALGSQPASSVYAACDGWVSRVEWLTYSYGYYVIVDCGDGWTTLYSHFREIIVRWGETVRKGETILGISGSTGFSTGEHLHFEIRYNGQYLDPADYLNFW